MGSGKKNIDKNKIGRQTPPQPQAMNIAGQSYRNAALAFVGFNGVKKTMPILGKPHHAQGGAKPNNVAAIPKSIPNTAQSNGFVVKSAKNGNIPAQTATPAPVASSVIVTTHPLGAAAQAQSGVDGINGDANVIQDDDALLAQILEQKRILDEQIAALLSMKKKPNFP